MWDMKPILISFFAISLTSCQNDESNYLSEIQKLNRKLDSLHAKIDTISKLSKTEVLVTKVDTSSLIKQIRRPGKQIAKFDSTQIQKQIIGKVKSIKEDTLRYYFQNSKKLSALITPRENGKWKLILFNQKGEKTYEFENVISSYSNTSEIKEFHSNGAIYSISCSMNPGASMYMYHSTYYFDLDNKPTKKESSQTPANSLDDFKNYEWDAATKTWIQKFPPIQNK